ncbi:hypothetical protein [Nocardioides sp.]|uniref:hypothetical protein n=1 Tax=Nocardioides sp. TaxID=35761 RepID=UPI002CB0C75F|nr:hypothetical protein [Nocardioides sp.]HXH78408.1 hypothetical protein [Nocardioides sp.]
MAVIALTSASGSPGVTTTCVGFALSWPRPVLLVEADPTGASGVLAGYFRGTREYNVGLIELALSPAAPADALRDVVRPLNGSDAWFIAGTRSPAQSGALTRLWAPLAEALADLDESGQDVIVDAGRLGLAGSPEPLLAAADLTLLVSRSTLPALAAARAWASVVRRDSAWRQTGVLLIGDGQPYGHGEVGKVLDLPVIASVAEAPEAAAVFHRGAPAPRNFESGPLVRSLRAATASVQAYVARSHFELVGQP